MAGEILGSVASEHIGYGTRRIQAHQPIAKSCPREIGMGRDFRRSRTGIEDPDCRFQIKQSRVRRPFPTINHLQLPPLKHYTLMSSYILPIIKNSLSEVNAKMSNTNFRYVYYSKLLYLFGY